MSQTTKKRQFNQITKKVVLILVEITTAAFDLAA